MSSLLTAPRSRSILEIPAAAMLPSFGIGTASKEIDARLQSMRRLLTQAVSGIAREKDSVSARGDIGGRLREKLISMKRITSIIAMYLDADWRQRLFARLDEICDPSDWDPESELPSEPSFSTFLRMIVYLHPTRRPGIGLSRNGHFLAAWTRDTDRIVIECVGNDQVRWTISRTTDGECEFGAGTGPLHRVPDVTVGYNPQPLFTNGHKILA